MLPRNPFHFVMKVLVVLGHNNYNQSVQNRKLVAQLAGLKNVEVLNLWERYAAQGFQLTAEQVQADVERVLAADRIVFQFPMHWYNLPWCLKAWEDQVFSAISFTDQKPRMAGKELAIATSTASPSTEYQRVCENGRTIAENITWPYRGSAEYLEMTYHGSFFFYPDAEGVFADYAAFVAK